MAAARLKYNHQSAAVSRKMTVIAVPRPRSMSSPDAVAPVTTIDSPSATITNSWNRSAKWALSSCQSVEDTRPPHGVQYLAYGPA
jgi:hypothetical protein